MISLIVAMAKNQVIGKGGQLPWQLPADLAYFKRLTTGHPVIMGRNTFESIGKPLAGRKNIVITRDSNFQKEGCIILRSLDAALDFCNGKEVFVIGGAQIYREFLPYADRLYITFINEAFAGDSFFPEFDWSAWRLISKIKGDKNEQNPYDFSFLIYEKNRR
jgi:Dihydrofolate reductase